jgi:hypothetical protein
MGLQIPSRLQVVMGKRCSLGLIVTYNVGGEDQPRFSSKPPTSRPDGRAADDEFGGGQLQGLTRTREGSQDPLTTARALKVHLLDSPRIVFAKQSPVDFFHARAREMGLGYRLEGPLSPW